MIDLESCFNKSWIAVNLAGLVCLEVEAAVVPAIVAVNTLGIAGVHLKEETGVKHSNVNQVSPWASY